MFCHSKGLVVIWSKHEIDFCNLVKAWEYKYISICLDGRLFIKFYSLALLTYFSTIFLFTYIMSKKYYIIFFKKIFQIIYYQLTLNFKALLGGHSHPKVIFVSPFYLFFLLEIKILGFSHAYVSRFKNFPGSNYNGLSFKVHIA